jgi:hypothetical protein
LCFEAFFISGVASDLVEHLAAAVAEMGFFSGKALFVLALCSLLGFEMAAATDFIVGGQGGWSIPTGSERESLSQWAERLRFHVGDALLFKYPANQDSVLLVSRDAFQNCNTTNPAATYNDGNTAFKFPRPGPYYFISGAQGHCEKGQKLVVVVMTHRGRRSNGAPAEAPALGSSPAFSPATVPGDEVSPALSPLGAPAVAPSSGDAAPQILSLAPLAVALLVSAAGFWTVL